MNEAGPKPYIDPPPPDNKIIPGNIESSSFKTPDTPNFIASKTSEKLEQIHIQLRQLSQMPNRGPTSSQQPHTEIKPRGFPQSPLKVIRNTVFYPTWEAGVSASLALASTTIPFYLLSPALEIPLAIGRIPMFVGACYVFFEAGRLIARAKNVSDFFKVTKIMPSKEKSLQDGTQITLDDFVGELHMSGIVKQWKLAFMKDKVKRALIISEGILQGLINIGEKVENNDPWFHDFRAFKGTSWIVNSRIAQKFGFEVSKPQNDRFLYALLRKLDKIITLTPEIAPANGINVAWISKEKFLRIYQSGLIQEELEKIKRALGRRA